MRNYKVWPRPINFYFIIDQLIIEDPQMSEHSQNNHFQTEITNMRWGVRSKHAESSNPQQFKENFQTEQELRLTTEKLIESQRQKNIELFSRLQAMRGEHQMLKNTQVDPTLLKTNHHHSKNQSQSLQRSHKSRRSSHEKKPTHRLNSSASMASMKKHKILMKKDFMNPPAYSIEKHQLQIQLNNTMKKLEQSLQREIILKKAMHELQNKLNTRQVRVEKSIENIDQSQAIKLRQEMDKVESRNREMAVRIGRLEGEKAELEYELSKYKINIRELHEEMLSMKLKFENDLLEYKKAEMERQIKTKDAYHEIDRLKGLLVSQQNKSHPSQTNHQICERTIRELQQELLKKQQEINNKMHNTHEPNSQKLTQILNHITERIARSKEQQKESAVQNQLSILKNQILSLNNNKSEGGDFGLESKVLSLEKTITFENKQRDKFADELKSIAQELQLYKKLYDDLSFDYQTMREQLQRKIKKLEGQLEQQRNLIPGNPNLNHLRNKLNYQEGEIERLNRELDFLRRKYQTIESNLLNEIRQLRGRLNDAEIAAKRNLNQKNLGLEMSKKQLMNNEQSFHYNITRILAEKEAWRQQFGEIKQKYDTLWLKSANTQNEKTEMIQEIMRQRHEESQNYRKEHERQMEALRQKYSQDHQNLLNQLDRLKIMTEQQGEIARKYGVLESEVLQLRKLCAKTHSTRANVFHLWEIKEVEYHNVHQILNQCKANHLMISRLEQKSHPYRGLSPQRNLVDSKNEDAIEGALFNHLSNNVNNPQNNNIQVNLYDNFLNNQQSNSLSQSDNFGHNSNSNSFQPQIINYSRQ